MARKTEVEVEVEMKSIVITVDHVYLPLDDGGNVPVEWRDVPGPIDYETDLTPNQRMALVAKLDTKKVLKRTRLMAPADLAEFLSSRDQAEIV